MSSIGYSACRVLALLALAFVLVRPVCAAWDGHGEPSAAHPAPCCSSIDDAASLAPAPVKVPDAKAAPVFVAPAFAVRFLAVSRPLPGSAPPRASPPRSLAYHARSSRILS